MSKKYNLVAVVVFALLTVCSMHAETIGDSVLGFSGTQGLNNWYYGWFDALPPSGSTCASSSVNSAYDPACLTPDFTLHQFSAFHTAGQVDPSTTYTYDTWDHGVDPLTGKSVPPPYTMIQAERMHPKGTNYLQDGDAGQLEWAVRQWVSPLDRMVHIFSNVAKFDTSGGTGVFTAIYINQTLWYDQYLAGTDGTGFASDAWVQVHPGDVVSFVVAPNGADLFDTTTFTAQIQNPEPSTFFLLATGLGLAFLIRRKRVA